MRSIIAFILVFSGSLMAFSAEYIVKVKANQFSSFSPASIEGVQVLDSHEVGSLHKVEIPSSKSGTALVSLQQNESVEYVVADFKLKAFRTPPSTQVLKDQWALAKVNAKKAWDLAGNKGSKNVKVAVIDTGVDYRHESLKSNMIPGHDFLGKDSDPDDETGSRNPGHGTHCAGIVGANGLVDGGVIGISPQVSIMPLRFLGANGQGDLMAGIRSVDYAIEKGVKIISASWGAAVSRSQAKPLIEAVQRANDAGVIFIAAAANDGKNNDVRDIFPANAKFENTISVAASGNNDEKPSWSNYGRAMVDLAAPGLNIMSTLPKHKYGNLSGTSMATPLVSGLVALLAAQYPDITGAQARSLLQATGAQVQIETACNCRIDAGAAMEALLNEKMVVVPAAGTLAVNDTIKMSAFRGQGKVTFTSSNPAIGEVSADGTLKAKAKGSFKITAKDASGNTSSSLEMFVGKASTDNGGGGGKCPLGDQQLCDVICQINPNQPFCK